MACPASRSSIPPAAPAARPMALFTRRVPEIDVLPVEGRADLALISEEDAEELADVLADDTLDRAATEYLTSDAARALEAGLLALADLEASDQETIDTARWVARVGYMARVAEWQRLPEARKPNGWMIAGLRGAVEASVAEELNDADDHKSLDEALGEVTAFFVLREPLDVPYDADEGLKPMWSIPGMGGDFRALLRERTLAIALGLDDPRYGGVVEPIDAASFEDLEWVWKYGFLLRSFEEFFREE
jgi:hypothetical protein